MKNIELKPNDNIIQYVIEHIEELKDARIMLTDVDLSKYGYINSTKIDVIREKTKLIDKLKGNKNQAETYIIDYEYFLKGNKSVSMLVRETLVLPDHAKTRELLKVFKNHDYTKTLFATDNMSPYEDSMFLIKSNAKQSEVISKEIFAVAKKDCVSNFIAKNRSKFEGKSIIISDEELAGKYLGCTTSEGKSFTVTPIDYKFPGQQNVINMQLTHVAEGDTGYYYVNNIIKRIHTATPIYDAANANSSKLVNIAETKVMTK